MPPVAILPVVQAEGTNNQKLDTRKTNLLRFAYFSDN